MYSWHPAGGMEGPADIGDTMMLMEAFSKLRWENLRLQAKKLHMEDASGKVFQLEQVNSKLLKVRGVAPPPHLCICGMWSCSAVALSPWWRGDCRGMVSPYGPGDRRLVPASGCVSRQQVPTSLASLAESNIDQTNGTLA